jgi:hypothetical protein
MKENNYVPNSEELIPKSKKEKQRGRKGKKQTPELTRADKASSGGNP